MKKAVLAHKAARVLVAAGLLAFGGTFSAAAQDVQAVGMDVYKSETCGCCAGWIDHMTLNDFVSTIHHPADLNAVKREHGIQPELQSCHTAITKDGYVFEGHVPARFVKQFLDAPPADAAGLLVPGMPLGSPGMEVGNRFTPYDILLLKKDGTTEVFTHVGDITEQSE
ncbi:MAG: DUF411 domain-containing protein [Pseudohongiellaceae bacterium]